MHHTRVAKNDNLVIEADAAISFSAKVSINSGQQKSNAAPRASSRIKLRMSAPSQNTTPFLAEPLNPSEPYALFAAVTPCGRQTAVRSIRSRIGFTESACVLTSSPPDIKENHTSLPATIQPRIKFRTLTSPGKAMAPSSSNNISNAVSGSNEAMTTCSIPVSHKRAREECLDSDSSSLSSMSRSPTPPTIKSSPPTINEDSDSNSMLRTAKRRRKTPESQVGKPTTKLPITIGRPIQISRKHRAAQRDAWMDPKSEQWDVMRFLNTPEAMPEDHLLQLPPKNFTYVASSRRDVTFDKTRYQYGNNQPPEAPHPKFANHIRNGTDNSINERYYRDLPHNHSLPIAGVIRQPEYDDQISSVEVLTSDQSQEEGFHSRPSIKLIMPDHLKAILVDDWENVTKNQQLVPIPSAHPVSSILEDYLGDERRRREPGSPQADILEEAVAGLKTYFDKCLGRILLYRFERTQYLDILAATQATSGDLAGKTIGEIYGAEHFCRLLVSLPELIAQTNMDQQSVNRLREELLKVQSYLAKNYQKYFVSEYDTPTQTYIDQARSG